MPPVNDGSVSRDTWFGSDDSSNAMFKKGIGSVIFRNGKRIFDYEWNEMQDILLSAIKDSNIDSFTDGVLLTDVFSDGAPIDSYAVHYSGGVLSVNAGRARVAGLWMNMYSSTASVAPFSLSGFALPAAGHLQYIYIDAYDREVETNGANPYVDATLSSNGNDPYLVSPLGEMQRRYQIFNWRTDLKFNLDSMPIVVGHRQLLLATVDSTGAVVDKRTISRAKDVFLPGSIANVDVTISSSSTINVTAPAARLLPYSGVAWGLTLITQQYFTAGSLLLVSGSDGNTINIRHNNGGFAGTGKIQLAYGTDVNLTSSKSFLILQYRSDGDWAEVSRSFGDNMSLGYAANTVLTLSGTAVAPTQANHSITGTGTLNNMAITNFTPGRFLVIQGTNGQTLTIGNMAGSTGQVQLADRLPCVLTSAADYLTFQLVGTQWNEVSRSIGLVSSDPGVFGARLSTHSTDPLGNSFPWTTLYLLPFRGERISLFNGSSWDSYALGSSGVNMAVPATTNTVYDIFVYLNAGVLTLEAVIWLNANQRVTQLQVQNGVYVKNGSPSHRYVGTISTSGTSGRTEDSQTNRFVWNYYNRVRKDMFGLDNSASWTYTSSTWRQANNSSVNQINFVVGLMEDYVTVFGTLAASCNPGSGNYLIMLSAIGCNSTNGSATPGGAVLGVASNSSLSGPERFQLQSRVETLPATGRNFFALLESVTSYSGTPIIYGANSVPSQSCITGTLLF